MSDSGKRKSRLVADKRYGSSAGKTRKTTAKAKSSSGGKSKKTTTAKRRTAKRRPPKRTGIIGFFQNLLLLIYKIIWRLTVRITILGALVLGAFVFYEYAKMPDFRSLVDGRARGSVTLRDRYGEVFAWRGDQFGGVVTVDTVSPYLKNAVIATEDKRFYSHFGVSPRGVASAIRINLSEGRGPLSGHGGSTITQQTAKLLCLGVEFDKTVWKTEAAYVAECRRSSLGRKAKEAIFALAMEAKFSKDEILAIYLNRAYMGGGAYGAEAASQRYFAKPASNLTAPEAAMLAGLLTAPSTLAPTSNIERSQARAATVLRLMREQGYLTVQEERTSQANPAQLSDAADARAGGYFADWVMSSGPEYFTKNTTDDVELITTLDQRIQTAAENAMKAVFAEKVKEGSKAQAAIVVMSSDGAVRGMVGGRRTNVSGLFNRATQAKRQTGSAFKPFVYATALELGYSPLDTVVDEPMCLNIPGSGQWCPKNYTNEFLGTVTLTDALKLSLNIPAVKVSESVGRENVHKVAGDFGIENDLTDTPALALGASESTLIEMTGAYAGILNGGSSVTPYGLVELRQKGENEPLMEATGGIGERVIREEAAQQLVYMMEKVLTEGSGRRAQLPDRPAAGKTGTTQAARDAWFIGFTADYVAGVWMGYDDNTPLKGVTGGGLPAEIWRETMVRVHEGVPVSPLPKLEPAPVRKAPTQNPAAPERKRDSVLQQVLRDLLGGGQN